MLFSIPRRGTRAGKPGFTLVELLVVIGIIAVLISILLPSLSRAREQANATKCLSNLRQIGQAFNMYTAENKGFIVAGSIQWYTTTPQGGRGEENWATTLVMMKYLTALSQLDGALGDSGSPVGENAYQADTSFGDTVFRCPSGADVKGNVGSNLGLAVTKTDPANDGFWRRQSILYAGTGSTAPMIDTWYAANMYQPTAAEMLSATGQDAFPMRVMARNRAGTPGRMFGGPMSRITQIKKASEMVLLFDGLRAHNYNTANISLRHSNKKYANFMFADGHAETVEGSALPDGITQATSDLRSADAMNQAKKFWPKWRLDQP